MQSDTLLLADIFKRFRNKYIEIYELDPANFLSAPRSAWLVCLKKKKKEKKKEVKLELLIDLDMSLMKDFRYRYFT